MAKKPTHKEPEGRIRERGSDTARSERAEELLRVALIKYQTLFETFPLGITVSDEAGKIREANATAEKLLGVPKDEHTRRNIDGPEWRIVRPDGTPMPAEEYASVRALKEKRQVEDVEMGIVKPDGETTWISVSAAPLSLEGFGVVVTYGDITQRKQAEEALRRSEAEYRAVVEDQTELICRYLPGGTLTFVNGAYCRYFGREKVDLIGRSFLPLIPEEDRRIIHQIQTLISRDNPVVTIEHRVILQDGQLRWQQWSNRGIYGAQGRLLEIQAVGRDITERKQAEEEKNRLENQLRHAQKMQAIGTLAGGIAHDFNNLLMGIQGRASLMLTGVDASSPHFEHLNGIEEYVRSAAELTKQLLGFARGGRYEVKVTDLNELVDRSANLFGRTKKEISIHRKFQPELWMVEVDRRQIEQVLINLFVNAWQAMPAGGELYLQTENAALDGGYAKTHGVKPGSYVKVSVTDTGVGMDEATKQRVFDPFFTTKEMGRGTGLGLASAYGIVRNHEGIITIDSEKNQGSTFAVYLPATDKALSEEKEPVEGLLEGEGTILLVDDEEMILDVGKPMLERLGYKVLVARSGKEAKEAYQRNAGLIKMVILDMVMPQMSGGETFEQLKAINPNVKVLLSSGYSIDGRAREILARGCDGFIQKPFSCADLSRKLKEVLDRW